MSTAPARPNGFVTVSASNSQYPDGRTNVSTNPT
jgi:hypothetical protein